MGFFDKFKGNSKTPENKASREVNAIRRALSSNGRIPEVKVSKNISIPIDSYTPRCNTNVLIFGGNDDDRREKHIEPNITAFNRNYIIVDTDGTLHSKYSEQHESRGFSVSHIDLNHADETGYNPLGFVYNEQSARHLSQGIIDNIVEDIALDSKGIWEKAENSILFAVIWAVSETNGSATLSDVVDILAGGLPELDKLFSAENLNAVSEYKKFQQGTSPETQKGVVLSLAEKLAPLKSWNKGISATECMSHAREFVFGRKALFISLRQDGKSILTAGMIIRQLITAIIGEMEVKGIFRTQYPLHFMLNSIDKTGKIYDFDKVLGDATSHTFAFSIFAPSVASISNVFGEKRDDILGKCDAVIYFGKADFGTVEWISMEHIEDDNGQQADVPNEEIRALAKNIEEGKIFVKIRSLGAVTDEIAHV